MVMRDIALARRTGAHIHVQHVSTAEAIELIRRAKADGVRITAEATTHHFTLTDAACASYDPVFKVHPPLRTDADVAAVRAGLADGVIDAIATDHAPHEPHTKEYPFDHAPPGMLGLETALALALTELDLGLEQLVALMSLNPARIAGISDRHGRPIAPGEPANLAVLDPAERWTVRGSHMASRSHNTPYEGREVMGRIRHTVLHGDLVVDGGKPTR